jgi:hypothetical protein
MKSTHKTDQEKEISSWENEGGAHSSTAEDGMSRDEHRAWRYRGQEGFCPAETNAAMARLGITCVAIDYFHYRQYRYTNLKDAMAQAERDRLAPAGDGNPVGTVASLRETSLQNKQGPQCVVI